MDAQEYVKVTVIVEDSTSRRTTIFKKAKTPVFELKDRFQESTQAYMIDVEFLVELDDDQTIYTTRDEVLKGPSDET